MGALAIWDLFFSFIVFSFCLFGTLSVRANELHPHINFWFTLSIFESTWYEFLEITNKCHLITSKSNRAGVQIDFKQ